MDPDYVAWFINGEEVYRQTDEHIADLTHPSKLMMNIWNPVYDDWVGVWDDRVLPRFAYYDWVRYSSYTPGVVTLVQTIISLFSGRMILMILMTVDGKKT